MSSEEKKEKLRLLRNDALFKEKMLNLIEQVKFELKQDDNLVRTIKREMTKKAKDIVDLYVMDEFLFQKLSKGLVPTLEKNDFEKVVKLRELMLLDFKKNFEEIIQSRRDNNFVM